MDDLVPVALVKRARTWRRLAEAHAAGVHHELLCRTASACADYERVLHCQLDLVERASSLPERSRDLVADALARPGRAPLRLLVDAAERDARTAVSPITGA